MKQFILFFCLPFALLAGGEVKVIPHDQVKVFSHNGNSLSGVATSELGATQYEVWRSHLGVGSCTPKHKHETEEVFIFLSGKGKAVVGDEEYVFEAPCTVILPAGVDHQLFNIGDTPSDQIVVLGIGSSIYNENEEEMHLPWR